MSQGTDAGAPPSASGRALHEILTAAALGGLVVLLAAWTLGSFRGAGERLVLGYALAGALVLWLAERVRGGEAAPLLPRAPGAVVGAALALAVAVAVSLPSLRGSFLGDDFGYVQLFHAKPLRGFFRLGDISEGIWGRPLDEMRPLFAFTYKLDYLLHGSSAAGYHATNLFLHGVASALVVLIAVAAAGPSWSAVLAGILFAVAPVHAEPISWITGKVDSFATVFYLACFWLFLRFRASGSATAYGLSVLTMAAGLFSKEILLTMPALVVAYDVVLGRFGPQDERSPRAWARALLPYVPFALVAIGYVALRRIAVGSFGRERALGLHTFVRFGLDQDERLRQLFVPFPRILRGNVVDPWTACLAGLVLGGVLAAGFLLYARRRELPRTVAVVVFFGPVWYGITVLPLLVTYRTARHLYLPSAGVVIALAFLVLPMAKGGAITRQAARLLLAALLVCAHGVLLVRQNGLWLQAATLSRQSRADLERIARELPPGSAVVIDNLSGILRGSEVYLWRWALPFALQKPFAADDLYTPLRILEPPEIYCCPTPVWWQAKRPFVSALVTGADEDRVELYLAHWNEHRNALVLRKGRLERSILKLLVERALGGPVDATVTIDDTRADRLLAALAEAVRQYPERESP